jgi:hypothetical protein
LLEGHIAGFDFGRLLFLAAFWSEYLFLFYNALDALLADFASKYYGRKHEVVAGSPEISRLVNICRNHK